MIACNNRTHDFDNTILIIRFEFGEEYLRSES